MLGGFVMGDGEAVKVVPISAANRPRFGGEAVIRIAIAPAAFLREAARCVMT
jgi:hypothetical protein